MKNVLRNYLTGAALFGKDLTYSQFAYLLKPVLDSLKDDECIACAMINDGNEEFHATAPKFTFADLKEFYKELQARKITGGNCSHTITLIEDLAITEEEKKKFKSWIANQKK